MISLELLYLIMVCTLELVYLIRVVSFERVYLIVMTFFKLVYLIVMFLVEGLYLVVVIFVEAVHLGLVLLLHLLQLQQVLSLPLGLVLLQQLDLVLEAVGLLDELLLVGGVLLGVDLDLLGGLHDVHLQLASLLLGVGQQLLVSNHILLHVVDDLSAMLSMHSLKRRSDR